ncbi:hypothetical protein QJS10_CPA03g00813 [Acorus calamus]|uniref:Reverse transcriptase zinc-binding domain-containing protein n=1 Tax=Acorus calamus TaxID=4465 RepID=A0AAV9F555_ACOCL|nr:hypothetical protein QJS10_CPA03g00813 [Acorus calamus]
MSWNLVCLSKNRGGLGVLDLAEFNKALLAKWVWKFSDSPDAMWRTVVSGGLQGRRQRFLPLPKPSRCSSQVWKVIHRVGTPLSSVIRWRLGKGDRIRFWTFHWCGSGPLMTVYPELFEIASNKDGMVWEFWNDSEHGGGWTFHLQRRLSNVEFLQYTQPYCVITNFRIMEAEEDAPIWILTPSTGFNVNSVYLWWVEDRPFNGGVARKAHQIWNCKVPTKVRFFLWLAYNERLLTRAYRAIWRPGENSECPLCEQSLETVRHLFCECSMAREVWSKLGHVVGRAWNPDTLDQLWELGCRLSRREDRSIRSKVLQTLVPAVMWAIWRGRNDKIFVGTSVSPEGIWEGAKGSMSTWGCYCAGAHSVQVEQNALFVS